MELTVEKYLWDEEIFERRFNTIFCNGRIHGILNKNIGSFDVWHACMDFMCGRNEIIYSEKNSAKFSPKGGMYYLKKLLHKIKPSIKTWMDFASQKPQYDDLDILFISRDRFVEIDDGENQYKSDYLFYSIIHHMVMEHPSTKIALLCNIDSPQDLNITGYNVFKFIHPFDFIKSLFLSLRIIIRWKIIQKINPMLEGAISSSDFPYLNINDFLTFRVLFNAFLVDFAYFNAISALNPQVIVSNDDLIQLKPKTNNSNLVFITLQSAIISPMKEAYRRHFIREFGSDLVKSDYFICAGEYYKVLKEYSNVSKKVVVMGQPRYDILVHIDKIYNRMKVTSDLGLDPNKKIVLWCTQTHGLSLDENISCINAVYSAMASIQNDAQLLIKLHPDEDQNAPLYHENTLCQPMILRRDVDTYALLYICDLMITKNSTTGMEAVILNKPVIVLNLSEDPDRVNYVREGVALGVYDPANLSSAIEKLLDDGSILHEKRERYIEKYLYKVDGKATERVVNLIKSQLEISKL